MESDATVAHVASRAATKQGWSDEVTGVLLSAVF